MNDARNVSGAGRAMNRSSAAQPARFVALVPPDLEAGLRLAGADTRVVADAAAAEREVARLLSEGERGVIAVYETFLAGFDPKLRASLEASVAPVTIPVPSGLATGGATDRRARMAARLQRAVGYHISLGGQGS